MTAPSLGDDFFSQVEKVDQQRIKVRWYCCVITNLAAFNYPDVIPETWKHCWKHFLAVLDHDEQFRIAQQFMESLIKATGLIGAARAGNAVRQLSKCLPADLRDKESRRSKESRETATTRGKLFHQSVYGQNPNYDFDATPSASPDYTFVVRDLFYGHVFSFPEILDDFETRFVIVSALMGMDCQMQIGNQIKGMLYNGGSEEDVEWVRGLCLDVAGRLGVSLRSMS